MRPTISSGRVSNNREIDNCDSIPPLTPKSIEYVKYNCHAAESYELQKYAAAIARPPIPNMSGCGYLLANTPGRVPTKLENAATPVPTVPIIA